MVEQALLLAEELQNKITQNLSEQEKSFHKKMQLLLNNPKNKAMLIELLDRSFRCKDRAANFAFIEHTFKKYGIANFFNIFEKVLLFVFLTFGRFAPRVSVPFFVKHLRDDTKAMVLDSSASILKTHIKKRKDENNIVLNINIIGEEVLGEIESSARIKKYEDALKTPYITYISIKITTIFSQINIIDFEYSKAEVVKRLDCLYALAMDEEKKQGIQKFINLDMEEYRDLELTVDCFIESISKFDIEAGIVLQAYIPDSYHYLQKLFAFSKERVENSLKPIKIRFVKGANMESEETIASQRGWALPTFSHKIDTDSNYNKMLDFILDNNNYKYIKIGIASHNIFEIAYAYTRISAASALDSFTFEMLEGMSLQCAYELSKMHNLILYSPVCDKANFNNAIAYLVRRLDENTSEDNFMRYFFNLKVGDSNWNTQKELFLKSLDNIPNINNATRRIQDRNNEVNIPSYEPTIFRNEPDTDFILPQNRVWAKNIKSKYENIGPLDIYPVIGEQLHDETLEKHEIFDKIHNRKIATVHLASEPLIKQALQVARSSTFSELSFDEIHQRLAKAAQLFRERRGDLIGIASLEVGKTFVELDMEVSEAIDFLEFYPHSLHVLQSQNPNTLFSPKGIGITIAPWNFPIGISAGTIAAPLAAGNRVIYKPSSLSSVTGYMLCKCFWDSGIPKDALIFLPTKGSYISHYLQHDVDIKFAILTGSEDTAYALLKAKPTLMLSAETGGKNATIVSKMADRDQAVKNIIHSAFSNSGQKCSATSLLVLEEEVYNDEDFKKTLIDAACSMPVGSAFELKNKIAALADKPSDKLNKALENLKPYEEWVLKPRFIDNNCHLMTPGIKYGTRVGDYTHLTELFAPILSVMCAKDLEHAIDIVNATGYGLTAGLESLDEREWEFFHTRVEAGNIYINKPTTGAIVLRQPFGGIKKSAIGFGRKVGIYNYITQFLDIKQEQADDNLCENAMSAKITDFISKNKLSVAQEESLQTVLLMAKSYVFHKEKEFDISKDYVQIRGEDNLFSYTKIKSLAYRLSDETLTDVLSVLVASNIVEIPLTLSYDENQHIDFIKNFAKNLDLNVLFVKESVKEFCKTIPDFDRIRYLGNRDMGDDIYKAAALHAKIIINTAPLVNGRFELLFYYYEKVLSISYHRYGNLGVRALKR